MTQARNSERAFQTPKTGARIRVVAGGKKGGGIVAAAKDSGVQEAAKLMEDEHYKRKKKKKNLIFCKFVEPSKSIFSYISDLLLMFAIPAGKGRCNCSPRASKTSGTKYCFLVNQKNMATMQIFKSERLHDVHLSFSQKQNIVTITLLIMLAIITLLSNNVKIKIHRTITLPAVLYGCETWLFTLREECRLRVFENRVLRRIFWPERDEVRGEWRRLHNEELYALY
jgi:hypothetical protein